MQLSKRQPLVRSSNRLLVTVAAATLAVVVVFSVFYVIGAMVALAALAAAGVALMAGLTWLLLKPRHRRSGSPSPTQQPR